MIYLDLLIIILSQTFQQFKFYIVIILILTMLSTGETLSNGKTFLRKFLEILKRTLTSSYGAYRAFTGEHCHIYRYRTFNPFATGAILLCS